MDSEITDMLDGDNSESYIRWFDLRSTQFLLSLLDTSNLAEEARRACLDTLLRSAFDAGNTNGSSRVAAMVLKKMMDHREKMRER